MEECDARHIHAAFSGAQVLLHSRGWHSSPRCGAPCEHRGVSMSMMRFLIVPALFAAIVPLAQAQNVSFNPTLSGPVVRGVYGQVESANGPPPVVYAQPVIAAPSPIVVAAAPVEPIYLHVPPGHAKNWHKYCHQYRACERPVYFVKSS